MSGNEKDLAVIKTAIAPIYLHPHFQSELADEGLHGMTVEILEKQAGGWCHIETHYGYQGYIHEKELLIDTKAALKWQEKADCYIYQSIADIMAEPKYASYPMILLTRGAFVQPTGEKEGGRVQIRLPEGAKGWVREAFVRKMSCLNPTEHEDTLRKNIIDTALSYMKTQYRWGGKSPMGIDCSGLSSMAYMLNGILLPRDTHLQQDAVTKIKREETKPGDLMFFPGHVVIYLGKGLFIHANGKDGMTAIGSFNKEDENYREDLDKGYLCSGTIFK